MRPNGVETVAVYLLAAGMFLVGCRTKSEPADAGAPPPLRVEIAGVPNVFKTDRPELFPLTTAVAHEAASELGVT